MIAERYNGPQWPTYRYYVYPAQQRMGQRVELVAFTPELDIVDGEVAIVAEVAHRLGYYADVPEARAAAGRHREHGVTW